MDNSSQQSRDLISYEPKILEIYPRELIPLVKEHHKIIWGMTEENKVLYLTAREIHEFYREENTFSKSLKTIYKYIKDLKDAGILVEGGRRITENRRNTEILYCLKSELIFLEDPPEEERFWAKDDSLREYADRIVPLIQSQIEDKIDPSKLRQFIRQFNAMQDRIIDDIVLRAEHDENIADAYRSIPSGKINQLNSSAALIVMLISNPQLFEMFSK